MCIYLNNILYSNKFINNGNVLFSAFVISMYIYTYYSLGGDFFEILFFNILYVLFDTK